MSEDKSVYQLNKEFLAKRLEGDTDEVISFFEELFDLYFGANAFHKLMIEHNLEALQKRIWSRNKEWKQQPLHIYFNEREHSMRDVQSFCNRKMKSLTASQDTKDVCSEIVDIINTRAGKKPRL
tara:strand:- start:1117 stop:1488 length:372 start_codon:yes stop_codon:yes gene_type:complete